MCFQTYRNLIGFREEFQKELQAARSATESAISLIKYVRVERNAIEKPSLFSFISRVDMSQLYTSKYVYYYTREQDQSKTSSF